VPLSSTEVLTGIGPTGPGIELYTTITRPRFGTDDQPSIPFLGSGVLGLNFPPNSLRTLATELPRPSRLLSSRPLSSQSFFARGLLKAHETDRPCGRRCDRMWRPKGDMSACVAAATRLGVSVRGPV
jgi:hypothetical protein